MENTRRSFLKKMTAAGIGTAGLALSSNAAATVTTETSAEKKKKPAGKDDGKLRFGFIGTGSRCHEHINNVLSIPGNKIVAICDIQAGPIQRTLDHIAKFNVPAPKVYTGSEREFEKMLNNEEFDCVIIASPWEWHVPMSVERRTQSGCGLFPSLDTRPYPLVDKASQTYCPRWRPRSRR
mgnify:CR=1 FL=1